MDRIGLDVAESILRLLDLPAAAKASEIGQLWYRAHRRRGAVVGYHPPEWLVDRRDRDRTEPEDLSFVCTAASLALINTPAVEWLVVSFPDSHLRIPGPFDERFLTEFVVAWLAMQRLPALRSLYVRIPVSLSVLGLENSRFLSSGDYSRVRHTLSLVCHAGCTPRLREFGLSVFDPANAFRSIWQGLRGRSLSTVKATFRSCLSCSSMKLNDALEGVFACASADIIFDVSGEICGHIHTTQTIPVLDDATDRLVLVFNACHPIPNSILSHAMMHNTCARLEVTVRPWEGEGEPWWYNAFDWWDHGQEAQAPEHRGRLKVLRFHLAGTDVKTEHLRAIVRHATNYYPGLEILEIDVRRNSIADRGLHALDRSHRLRRVAVWFSGRRIPSVAAADAWLASIHASCEPSVPMCDRSYRVFVTDEGGPDEAEEDGDDPQTRLRAMRLRMQQDLAVGR
jgi:hypothetical protein